MDSNVWGKPYNIVMDKLGYRNEHGLDKEEMENNLKELFPPGPTPENSTQGEIVRENIEEYLINEEELRGKPGYLKRARPRDRTASQMKS